MDPYWIPIPYGAGYALVDKRTRQDVIVAFIVVFLTFTALAVLGFIDPLRVLAF